MLIKNIKIEDKIELMNKMAFKVEWKIKYLGIKMTNITLLIVHLIFNLLI